MIQQNYLQLCITIFLDRYISFRVEYICIAMRLIKLERLTLQNRCRNIHIVIGKKFSSTATSGYASRTDIKRRWKKYVFTTFMLPFLSAEIKFHYFQWLTVKTHEPRQWFK